MKSEMIAVPINENSILIEHCLFIYITASFIQDLTNRTIPLERFVHDIQNIKSIWIKSLKNSNYYEVLLPESIVLCTLGKQSIEFNGIYEKSIRNHAEFIKDGIAIGLNNEVIVINQQSILNKQISKNCRQDEQYMEETIKHIVDTLKFISDQKQNIDVQVNYKLYEVEFENWLSAYDKSTTYQLETNIISQPQIKYIKVTSDDFETFTLSFYIDSILPFPFNHDYTYYIKTINNGWISAVLHERYTDGKSNVVVLLFNRQLSTSDLHVQGDIYLMVNHNQHNNESRRIYYSQLQSDNVLKALLSNQLNKQVEDTNHIKIQSKIDFSKEQQHIISQALLAKQLYYIDGAVTTGKTEILNYIKQYYENKKVRVLHITSQHQNLGDGADRGFSFNQLHNKIETLKINSLQALDKFESLILTDKKIVTSYSSDSLDLELAEADHKSLTEYLQQYYLEVKQNYIIPLKEILNEFTENEKLLEALYSDILRNEKKLIQQMEKNEFSRWLTLPVLIKLQAKIKKNYAKYIDVTNRQKIVTQTYNEKSVKLKELLTEEQLKIKKEMWQAQCNHIEQLKTRLLKPFYLDSIRIRTYTSKNEHTNVNKDDYFILINQLEQLHIALRQYRQALLRKHDNLFYAFLLKERQSISISMQRLNQHFSMFVNQFDVVIIDDAHTFTALELFLAISLGKKVVVAGEKNRTYVNTLQNHGIIDIFSTAPDLYKKSGAQILANLLPTYMQNELPHMYRVFPALTCLYHNFILHEDLKLKNRTDFRKLEVLPSVTHPIVLFTTSQTKQRFEHAISSDDIYNHCEAIAIVELIVSMLYFNENEEQNSNINMKLKPDDIIVTSFFSMQVDYIRTQLRYFAPALTIETIHSMVRPITACIGEEKKIVLLSMCVSNKQSSGDRDLKQLRQSHLWNIVLSRAQHQLLLIGDIDYIKGSICNEKRMLDAETALNMTSYDVANMMKSFVKLALDGDVQFVSLESYTKKVREMNGGFGYEQLN